jgi:hypothetical protein
MRTCLSLRSRRGVGCAPNVKRQDATPPPNPNIRGIYRRLKEQGKPDKVARTAAARKFLLLAHAIYESGDPFRLPAEEVT